MSVQYSDRLVKFCKYSVERKEKDDSIDIRANDTFDGILRCTIINVRIETLCINIGIIIGQITRSFVRILTKYFRR